MNSQKWHYRSWQIRKALSDKNLLAKKDIFYNFFKQKICKKSPSNWLSNSTKKKFYFETIKNAQFDGCFLWRVVFNEATLFAELLIDLYSVWLDNEQTYFGTTFPNGALVRLARHITNCIIRSTLSPSRVRNSSNYFNFAPRLLYQMIQRPLTERTEDAIAAVEQDIEENPNDSCVGNTAGGRPQLETWVLYHFVCRSGRNSNTGFPNARVVKLNQIFYQNEPHQILFLWL